MTDGEKTTSFVENAERAARVFFDELWSAGAGGASYFGRAVVHAGRVAWITIEGFYADRILLRASALTFASMMGLVPILALGFAVLRGLGWRGDRLEELILSKATILSPEAIQTIVSYIDNTNFAGLGVVGGSILFFTFVSVLTNVEGSFNAIWGNLSPRPVLRRVIDYFGLMMIAPLLLAVATSLTAAVQSSAIMQQLGTMWGVGPALERTMSYTAQVLVWLLFAFLYMFVPNTRVRVVPALVGGVAAGFVWQVTQWGYIRFQIGMAKYNAIYGALAQLPLLMAWIYVSWVIVLLGAEVAFAVQNVGSYRRDRRIAAAGGRHAVREYAGLRVAVELACAAEGKRPAADLSGLAGDLDLPPRLVRGLVLDLTGAGLAHVAGEQGQECYLSLAPERIPVAQVLDVFRGRIPESEPDRAPAVERNVRELFEAVSAARDTALHAMTLKDLVGGGPPKADPGDPADPGDRR
ncbi:MAG: YhjD/YihY/BrkB family envelope integrity protein [Candidatus Binatia bacterium]